MCNVKDSIQYNTTHLFSVPVPVSVVASVNTPSQGNTRLVLNLQLSLGKVASQKVMAIQISCLRLLDLLVVV